MAKKILITNPAHDDITRYLFEYSRPIISLAENKGHIVHEITFQGVNKKNVEKFITKQNPKLIIFHGHGATDKICGFEKKEILIEININDHMLKNKIIHSITCSSASELGDSVIKKGGLAYIGFKDEFWCPYNPIHVSNPEMDIMAKCNIEPVMQLSRSLVKNNTVKEAYNRSQETFRKWLDACERSDAPPELEGIGQFIFWNMINQDIIGDDGASLG